VEWRWVISVAAVPIVVSSDPYQANKEIKLSMKSWISRNKLYGIGALAGGIAGFLYWKYIGCLTGTCSITSRPLNSTLYFAVMGAVLFGIFKKEQKQHPDPSAHEVASKSE
jgi:hypothetical protein